MSPPPNLPRNDASDVCKGGLCEDELHGWAVQHGPALRRYFQKKVGAAEAEDLVQEVFLNMQVRGGGRGPIDNVEGYLFTVAANVLAKRHGGEGRIWGLLDPLEAGREPPDELSPERALIGKQSVEQVLAAIDGLPPRTGEAFALHRFEEMTYEAIGRRMGISPRTVENLIALALKRLIEHMRACS